MNTYFNKFILLTTTIFVYCSCTEDSVYDFKNPNDAINAYQTFLNETKDTKTINTVSFTSRLCKWQEVNDTVWQYLRRQPKTDQTRDYINQIYDIHDSVRHQMLRLSETWRYSYNDLLAIKEQTSSFRDDKDLQSAVNEAEPFFLSLDSIPVMPIDKSSLIKQYKLFLQEQKNRKFSSKEEMQTFIRREDRYFRSFLSQIQNMQGESLSDITRNTEIVCHNIFIAAREGKIPAKDVMVYMSMRTIRRLLHNSVLCISDIDKREISSKMEGNAYLWMIIQPFISIDQFAIVTLTPQEKSNFSYIVSRLPKSQGFARLFNIEQQSLNYLLPQQLLKIYILSF